MTPSCSSIPSVSFLGVRVDAVDLARAVEIIQSWIQGGEKHYVCLTNVHGGMECRRDPQLRDIYNSAGLSTPDGMPLVWLSRWHGFPRTGRVYGPDLMLALCERTEASSHRHFLYGGAEGVAAQLEATLKERFPDLQVAGRWTPPHRELYPRGRRARRAGHQRLRSGSRLGRAGNGKPDRFMASHAERLRASVLIGVGAAFDFLSGEKHQAPRLLQRCGLEWLFRLANEAEKALAPLPRRQPGLRRVGSGGAHPCASATSKGSRVDPHLN